MTHSDPVLSELQRQLAEFQAGRLSLHAFVQAARQAPAALLSQLPAAFGEVWHNLLDRLESSALFAEESCSFSQKDLIDSLQLWIDKAAQRLSSSRGT